MDALESRQVHRMWLTVRAVSDIRDGRQGRVNPDWALFCIFPFVSGGRSLAPGFDDCDLLYVCVKRIIIVLSNPKVSDFEMDFDESAV